MYCIPFNWFEAYTTYINADNTSGLPCPRYEALRDLAEQYGIKVHKTTTTMQNMIPLQDILTSQSGTPIEQTTPNLQPYLEGYRDTNYTEGAIAYKPDNMKLINHLKNPQLVHLFSPTAKNHELAPCTLGSMEIMKAGDRKAYTQHWDDSRWYTFPTDHEGKHLANILLPQWGGAAKWTKPAQGQLNYNPMQTDQHLPLMLRMTPITDVNGALMKFRCRVQWQRSITFTVRLPPDGAGYYSNAVFGQHLHKFDGYDNHNVLTIYHPF